MLVVGGVLGRGCGVVVRGGVLALALGAGLVILGEAFEDRHDVHRGSGGVPGAVENLPFMAASRDLGRV